MKFKTLTLTLLASTLPSLATALSDKCAKPLRLVGGQAPSKGELHAAILFVDFPDAPASATEVPSSLASSLVDPAIGDILKQMSYNQLTLKTTLPIANYVRMPKGVHEYGWAQQMTQETITAFTRDALTAAGKDASFKDTSLLYIVPTSAAKGVLIEGQTGLTAVTAGDGSVINNTVIYGTSMISGGKWGVRGAVHKTGHALGLSDLFAWDGNGANDNDNGATATQNRFVGGFSLMGLISGQSPDLLAYEKWTLDWLADSESDDAKNQVSCVAASGSNNYTISAVEASSDTDAEKKKLLVVPASSTVSYLIEVRSKQGFDSSACSTGVLFYKADTSIAMGNGTVSVVSLTSNAVTDQCGSLGGGSVNNAPVGVGASFSDDAAGVKISVVESPSQDVYVVNVDRKADAPVPAPAQPPSAGGSGSPAPGQKNGGVSLRGGERWVSVVVGLGMVWWMLG